MAHMAHMERRAVQPTSSCLPGEYQHSGLVHYCHYSECLCRQGEQGDNFYVIQHGQFKATKVEGGCERLLFTYHDQGAFGELALMYNCPRAASVTVRSQWHNSCCCMTEHKCDERQRQPNFELSSQLWQQCLRVVQDRGRMAGGICCGREAGTDWACQIWELLSHMYVSIILVHMSNGCS